MSLSPGARIGPYEIINPIGAGGMGEVYRARDTSLQRDVALKILPDRFAHDPDRLARFHREAQVLASLNHPHIAQIHGVEISGAARVLVMEFVPGDTLDVRLRAARAGLPVPDVLDIGRQIAEALEAAHEQGIVHRDLKPANIKITSDGTVKVLDFGLAKLVDPALEAGRRSDVSDGLSQSPTLTSPAMATSAGMLLGTAAYMAPEQARGKTVDKRADIWAFGCVLFELLCGKPAFDGETVTDVLSAVVTRDPEWTALPDATPPTLRALVERCLVKDPRQRLRDIGEARIALGHSGTDRTLASTPPPRRLWRERAAWATAVVAVAISVAVLLRFRSADPASAPGALQFSIDLPVGLDPIATSAPTLSPDATQLAFRAVDDIGGSVVWLISLQIRTPHRLAGTEAASSLFWSPDGRDLAFFDNLRRLRAVDVASGAIRTVCSVPTEIGAPTGTWNADGDILFGGASGMLYRAPAVGGEPSGVSTLQSEELGHGRPSFLPDGRRFVFTVFREDRGADELWLGSLDDQNRRSFLAAGSFGKFVAPDFLLMFRSGQLLVQRLDVDRGTLVGEGVPVPADIGRFGEIAYSAAGNLLAFRGTAADQRRRFSWHTRTGAATGEITVPDNAQGVEIAPDGSRAVFEVFEEGLASRDLWLATLSTGATQKVAFTDADEADAKWMPDSRTIVYGSRRDAAGTLLELALDSREPPRPLEGFEKAELQQYPASISRNGQILAFMRGGFAFWTGLPHSKAEALPSAGALPTRPNVSPDGRWLLYEATTANRREIYLEPLPPTGARWPVSRDGGTWARWHPNGREIYFIARDNVMMAVSFQAAPTVQISPPVRLFQTAIASTTRSGVHANYDVTSDGRFLVVENVGTVERGASLRIIVNWQSLLPRAR